MEKIIRLTESQLTNVVKRLLNEQENIKFKLSDDVFYFDGKHTLSFYVYINNRREEDVDFVINTNTKNGVVEIRNTPDVSLDVLSEMKQIVQNLIINNKIPAGFCGTYMLDSRNLEPEGFENVYKPKRVTFIDEL